MANNFGDGYPGKTWKDAAAEVAWNALSLRRNRFDTAFPSEMNLQYFFSMKKSMICDVHLPWLSVKDIKINDFPAFRAAFMEWLKQNEVKR